MLSNRRNRSSICARKRIRSRPGSYLTLKMNLALSSRATSVSPTRKSMMPRIIQLHGASPGCTRAVRTTTCFLENQYSVTATL